MNGGGGARLNTYKIVKHIDLGYEIVEISHKDNFNIYKQCFYIM